MPITHRHMKVFSAVIEAGSVSRAATRLNLTQPAVSIALSNLEALKEIAHMEKLILDRFGTTDFEIGEGFLERRIGKEDPDTYGLWP